MLFQFDEANLQEDLLFLNAFKITMHLIDVSYSEIQSDSLVPYWNMQVVISAASLLITGQPAVQSAREEAAQLRQGPGHMEGEVRSPGCGAGHVPARGPHLQHRALQGQEPLRGEFGGHHQRSPRQQSSSG